MASILGGQAPYYFYCHQCVRSVRLLDPGELVCPYCNGEFLEEMGTRRGEDAAEAPNMEDSGVDGHGNAQQMPITLNQLLEDMSAFLRQAEMGQEVEGGDGGFGIRVRLGPSIETRNMPPLLVLGAPIHNVFALRNGGPDFFVGPELERFIQHLAEDDLNRHGTPAASKAAIASLPTITISQDMVGTDSAQCAVCKDEFEKGLEVKQLPCKHMYHQDCILPWLSLHNSCPLCRFELPTDDPDYERGIARRQREFPSASQSSGHSNDEAADTSRRAIQGRFFQYMDRPVERGQHEGSSEDGVAGNDGRPRESEIGPTTTSSSSGRRFSLVFPWIRALLQSSSSSANNAQGRRHGGTSRGNDGAGGDQESGGSTSSI